MPLFNVWACLPETVPLWFAIPVLSAIPVAGALLGILRARRMWAAMYGIPTEDVPAESETSIFRSSLAGADLLLALRSVDLTGNRSNGGPDAR
jgi:hypothetical protein